MKPYKGYTATLWLDTEDRLFHGSVEGTRDVIHFAGGSIDELETAFHGSVDDYLDWCARDGVAPEKPYSGKLAFRTSAARHRLIAEAAGKKSVSINQWMDDALAEAATRVLAEDVQTIRKA